MRKPYQRAREKRWIFIRQFEKGDSGKIESKGWVLRSCRWVRWPKGWIPGMGQHPVTYYDAVVARLCGGLYRLRQLEDENGQLSHIYFEVDLCGGVELPKDLVDWREGPRQEVKDWIKRGTGLHRSASKG